MKSLGVAISGVIVGLAVFVTSHFLLADITTGIIKVDNLLKVLIPTVLLVCIAGGSLWYALTIREREGSEKQ